MADDQETTDESVETVLRAKTYILYNSNHYRPGDALPTNNATLLAAWLAAGTAAWVPVSDPAAKALPVTAPPGLAGDALLSESEDGDNLAGKVPKTRARRRKRG